MGRITSLFARKVVAQVGDADARDRLLRSVGLGPDEDADPAEMLPDTDYYAFFESAARADPEGTTLPLRVGASMRCDDYGAFGLAFKSAQTLGGSYRRAERFAQVLTSVSTYEVERTDAGVYMHLHREGERRLGMRLSNEATVASVFAISNEVSSRPVEPLAVHFKHPAPGSVEGHRAHFGCPVHFETDRDALQLEAESLEVSNRLGDASISAFFQAHLEVEVATLHPEEALEVRVGNEVMRSLSEGIPGLLDIARRVGMSSRTLQRRLAARDLTYQAVVDAARRRLAQRLLRETEFSLAEVAYMTGYSEQSAFTRAFRRWSGETPRSFRLGEGSRS